MVAVKEVLELIEPATGVAVMAPEAHPRRLIAGKGAISASVRRDAANYLEFDLVLLPRALWRAVGGDQPGFPDHGLGAGNAQAGSFEIRPGLLRAVGPTGRMSSRSPLARAYGHAGFNLRGKAGQNGEGGGNKRGNGDG